MKGTVIFFNAAKGWGFIKNSEDGTEVFVHHTGIIATGYRELKKDQKVSFDTEMGDKGKLQAINVKVVK